MRSISNNPLLTCAILAAAGAFALLAGSCFGGEEPEYPVDRPPGITHFDSPIATSNARFGGAVDTATPPGPTNPGTGAPETTDRLIEEGDIVKLEGSTLFVLNRYRGLQVVDLADPTNPRLSSSARFYGNPVELYIRDQRAYALVAGERAWAPCTACEGGVMEVAASKLHVVDVSNPAALVEVAALDIEGDVTDSRIVGDVLYAVSHQYAWGYGYVVPAREGVAAASVQPMEDKTFVASFSIADPSHPTQIARLDFPRNGWDDHIFVSQSAIFIASAAFGEWEGEGGCTGWEPCTRITHIDIRDPNGTLALRSHRVIAGFVQDRWQLDYDEVRGVLRVVTSDLGWNMNAGGPELSTFTVTDAAITPLGSIEIPLANPESTTAVRFDGDRAYVVTFLRIDPLFTVDLSNPALPVVAGSLESPGWLDYIEPRGDRLVALGHDQAPDGRWRLQVSLYDVSALDQPLLIDREGFGEDWGWTPGERDDFQKMFRVLDDLGLILVPYTSWKTDGTGWWARTFGNVQLLDFTRDTLVLRGHAEQNGFTERALPLPGDRIVALSSEVLDVIDIQNRDEPAVEGTLQLARNVIDISVEGSIGVEYSGDWYSGTTALDIVHAATPDEAPPLGHLDFAWPWGQMFSNGDFTYVVSDASYSSTTEQMPPRVTVVDVADPSNPFIRGSLELPDGTTTGGYCPYAFDAAFAGPRYCGAGRELAQMDGGYIVLHRPGRCAEYDQTTWECLVSDPNRLFIIDLRAPDSPVIAGQVSLGTADWMYGLTVQGRMLYLTHYEPHTRSDGTWWARYYLDRVDATDAAAPVVLAKINIPGQFLGASSDNRIIYSREDWYTNAQTLGMIHALELSGDTAVLRGSFSSAGYLSDVALTPDTAYATMWRANSAGTSVESSLVAVDLRDPSSLAATETPLPAIAGYGWWGEVTAAGTHVLIASWGGLLVYDAADALHPQYVSYTRTQGYSNHVEVSGGFAYVPAGWFGVAVIPIEAQP